MTEPCRYAADEAHTCVRNTGAPIRAGETCWLEANAQLLDSRPAIRVLGQSQTSCATHLRVALPDSCGAAS